MNEEWKTILEASDYEVSNTGKNGWVFDCPGIEIEEAEE